MKELLSGLIGSVTGIIDKVVADKDQAAKLVHDITTMADRHAQEAMLAQIAVNEAERGQRQLVSAFVEAAMRVCVRSRVGNQLSNFADSRRL